MKKLTIRQRQRIAKSVSATLPGRATVDEQAVADVESGVNFSESHPVHQRIAAEIKAMKSQTAK